ncbi:MAG: hypothetical protein ABJN40_05835 [Sneathiella sp.]
MDEVTQLCEALMIAKQQESVAKARRTEIEDQLSAALGADGEGSKTHQVNGEFKVVITNKLNRKVDDPSGYQAFAKETPDHLNPISIVESFKISETKCRELRNYKPDIYAKLAKILSTKSARTAVKIERIETDGI